MTESQSIWNPELYNDKHSFVFDYGHSLIELLSPQSGERILDLGCGSGQLTAKIAEITADVVGIDNSSHMIGDAQSKFPELTFNVADAANFNFEKPFDAIFSNAALHWVLDHLAAIECMYANLNSGGRLIIEMGGKDNIRTIVNQLRTVLRKHGYTSQSEIELWYFPSVGEYTAALESVGFRVASAQHYDRPTPLVDNENGIKDWISMFGSRFFENVSEGHVNEILNEVQEAVRPQCLIEDTWYADYKRLRIKAIKE